LSPRSAAWGLFVVWTSPARFRARLWVAVTTPTTTSASSPPSSEATFVSPATPSTSNVPRPNAAPSKRNGACKNSTAAMAPSLGAPPAPSRRRPTGRSVRGGGRMRGESAGSWVTDLLGGAEVDAGRRVPSDAQVPAHRPGWADGARRITSFCVPAVCTEPPWRCGPSPTRQQGGTRGDL